MGSNWIRHCMGLGAMLIALASHGQCPYAVVKDRVAVCEKDYQGVIVPCERGPMRYFDPHYLRPDKLSLREVAKVEKLIRSSKIVQDALAEMECNFPMQGYMRYYGSYYGSNYHRKVVVGFMYRTQSFEQSIAHAEYLEETSRQMDKLLDDGGCRYFWVRLDLTDGKVEVAKVNGYA